MTNAGCRFESDAYRSLFDRIAAVRAHRDGFVDEVVAGDVPLEGVFERAANDPVLAGMKVLPAIENAPELMKVQTRRAFGDVGIDEAAHIDSVTAEAIAKLPAALESHAR